MALDPFAIAYVRAMGGASFTGVVPWSAFTLFLVIVYLGWRYFSPVLAANRKR